jgi:hypothetical protein
MKRGLLVLLAVILTGAAAALITRRLIQGPPSSWLCHEYALSPEKAERVRQLQAEYGSQCGPYCDRMCDANARLETVALGCGSVTPSLRDAVAETDSIRTQTRLAMLEHFYAVAAELPPDRRKEYLRKVLPLVIDSCGSH